MSEQLRSGDLLAVVIAEYESLREEIIKRLEFRYQLISLTLIISGTILSIGLQPTVPGSVLLIHPILALFLAASYIYNGIAIARVAKYLRECLEPKGLGFGWETFVKNQSTHVVPFRFLGIFPRIAAGGVFIITQLVTFAIALFRIQFNAIDWLLIGCAGIATILTILMFRYLARIH
ncbi:MAG: hypothetical protein QXP27_09950 [Candidatus Methanomethyliaceae archaeon]